MAHIPNVEIVRTKGFDRDLKRIGATESDYVALAKALGENPWLGTPFRA